MLHCRYHGYPYHRNPLFRKVSDYFAIANLRRVMAALRRRHNKWGAHYARPQVVIGMNKVRNDKMITQNCPAYKTISGHVFYTAKAVTEAY
jgi:hypothetical protein